MARRKFSDIENPNNSKKTTGKPVTKAGKRPSKKLAPSRTLTRNKPKNKQSHTDAYEPKQDKTLKKRQKLSDHFSRKDFHCKSDLAGKSFKISAGLVGALECLRSKADRRINIIKGYECPESAEKSGNLKRNYHVQGLAANISIDDMSLEEAYLLAEQLPEITGLSINYDEGHLHLRAKKEKERECWIEKNRQTIPITAENKQALILDKIKKQPTIARTEESIKVELESEPS